MQAPKFNIYKLMIDSFKAAPEKPSLQSFSTYILLKTEDKEDFILAENQDIDRCQFIGEVGDEFTFKDANNVVIPCKKENYKKRWVAVDTRTVQGSILDAAYEELAYMIQNQLPAHLKDKVKF
jgi:hypothetical protein